MPQSQRMDDLVGQAMEILARAELAPGEYKRYAVVGDTGDASINAYGVADAANLLYTLGHFPPCGHPARDGFVRSLQGLQQPDTGLWSERSHHDDHCTAHGLAALERFDASPRFALAALEPMRTPVGLVDMLERLDWLYCHARARRQTGHRVAEALQAMATSARWAVDSMRALDPKTDPVLNDLHMLFGAWSAFAELQITVPGLIRTRRPLKNVLDRRPFISNARAVRWGLIFEGLRCTPSTARPRANPTGTASPRGCGRVRSSG